MDDAKETTTFKEIDDTYEMWVTFYECTNCEMQTYWPCGRDLDFVFCPYCGMPVEDERDD